MSRHGYTENGEEDTLAFGRWRAQVANAIRGRRGQRLLRDLVAGLEAMPADRRELHAVVIDDGEHACALGVVARVRGLDLKDLNPFDDDGEFLDEWEIDDLHLSDALSSRLDVADQLAREVMYLNDDGPSDPRERWRQMYGWALRHARGLQPFAAHPVTGECVGTGFSGVYCSEYWQRRTCSGCTDPAPERLKAMAREDGAER